MTVKEDAAAASQLEATLKRILALYPQLEEAQEPWIQAIANGKTSTDAITEQVKEQLGLYHELATDRELEAKALDTQISTLGAVIKALGAKKEANKEILASLKLQQAELKKQQEPKRTLPGAPPAAASPGNSASFVKDVGDTLSGAGRDVADKIGKIMGGRVINWMEEVVDAGLEKAKAGALTAIGAYVVAKAGAEAAGDVAKGAISGLKDEYMNVNKVTTAYARMTGLIMDKDAAVRKGNDEEYTLAQRLIESQRAMKGLGVTTTELMETRTKLHTSSLTFGLLTAKNTSLTRDFTDHMVREATAFTRLGLSTENYAKALDVVGKTYKSDNVIGTTRDLGDQFVRMARASGRTVDSIAGDFEPAMKQLSAYSLPKAKEEFIKLNAIVAVTGVSMTTLLQTAGQYDELDKAANKVGDLNAMLGGPYLNTLDMVNATEAERIEMLREAVQASGQSFNEMDRFMQKSIASAVGMDVEQASKYFMGAQAEVDKVVAKSKDTTTTHEKMIQQAKENAVSINEQFKATSQSMVLVEKAYKNVDEIGRKIVKSLDVVANKVRSSIGGVASNALREFNDLLKSASEDGKTLGEVLTTVGKGLWSFAEESYEAMKSQKIMEGGGKPPSADSRDLESRAPGSVLTTSGEVVNRPPGHAAARLHQVTQDEKLRAEVREEKMKEQQSTAAAATVAQNLDVTLMLRGDVLARFIEEVGENLQNKVTAGALTYKPVSSWAGPYKGDRFK